MQTRSALLLVEARTKRLLESLELSIPLGTFPVLSNAINHQSSSPMSVRREAPKETETREMEIEMEMEVAPITHRIEDANVSRCSCDPSSILVVDRKTSSFLVLHHLRHDERILFSPESHTHINRQSPLSITTTTIIIIVEKREREGESGTNLRRIRSRLILAHVMLVNRPVLFDPQLRDRDLARVLLLQSSEVCKRVLDVRWLSEDVHSEAALPNTQTHTKTHT